MWTERGRTRVYLKGDTLARGDEKGKFEEGGVGEDNFSATVSTFAGLAAAGRWALSSAL